MDTKYTLGINKANTRSDILDADARLFGTTFGGKYEPL